MAIPRQDCSLALQKLEQLSATTLAVAESKRRSSILRNDKTYPEKCISLRSAEASIWKPIFIYMNGTDFCLQRESWRRVNITPTCDSRRQNNPWIEVLQHKIFRLPWAKLSQRRRVSCLSFLIRVLRSFIRRNHCVVPDPNPELVPLRSRNFRLIGGSVLAFGQALARIFGRCLPPQRGVGTNLVIVRPPSVDFLLGVSK